jgi:multicomponent Na+:H+ antiporter subunit C
MQFIFDHYNYWICIILMMIGFYAVIAKSNLVKKAIGLTIFQTGIFLFYISVAKVEGATVPVRVMHGAEDVVYSNPLPHAMILTAIVVAVSMLAVAMSLIVAIREAYGTVDEHDIHHLDEEQPD